jgi:hypothetical protein
MPPATVAALEAHGITDTTALLEAARLPGRRTDLASGLGIDPEEFDIWVSVADLARVTALSPGNATLVARAGIARNLQEFVSALPDPGAAAWSDPLALDHGPDETTLQVIERLTEYATVHGLDAHVPWPHDLVQAAGEARNLVPKLVLRDVGLDHDVAAGLAEIRAKTLRDARRTLIGTTVWLTGLVAVGLIVSALVMRGFVLRELATVAGAIEAAGTDATPVVVRNLALSFADSATMALSVLLASVIAAYVLILTTHTLVVEGWRWLGTRIILRDRTTRLAHLELLRFEAAQLPYLARLYRYWLVGMTVLLGALAWVMTATSPARLTFEQLAVIVVSVLVPVMVLLAFVPTTRYLLRRSRTHGALSPHVVRSLAAYNTFTTIIHLGILIGVLQAFPTLLTAPAAWASAVYVDRVETAQERAELALASSMQGSLNDDTGAAVRGWVRDLEARFAMAGTGLGTTIGGIGPALNRLRAYLTPSLLLAAVFAIVLPFLILGGWLRGAFFVLLLAAVSWTEIGAQRYVTANLFRWFELDETSRMVPLLVGLAVFGNAIVFEWVYELVLERKGTCVDCQADIERGAALCPVCGMRQAHTTPPARRHEVP